MADSFHRFYGEWVSQAEWATMPAVAARIAAAIGPEPLEDASYRLPALCLPGSPSPPPGPNPNAAFVAELTGNAALARIALLYALEDERLSESLLGAVFWGRAWNEWVALDRETGGPLREYASLALAWPLDRIAGKDLAEVAETLGRLSIAASALGLALGARSMLWDKPADAAERTLTLRRLGLALRTHVELTLRAGGAPFSSRRVWRELISLGLRWGTLDLFHWGDDSTGVRPLFSVAAVGLRSDFSPERAAEGETVSGIALGFELATSPAPLAVFDRMALALAFLGERLGGAPTHEGKPLDGDALEECRARIAETAALLDRAALKPGSPDALALL